MALFLGIILWCSIFAGCNKPKPQPQVYYPVLESAAESAVGLDSREDVEQALEVALKSEHCVVFVHVDWAILQPQRQAFYEFATACAQVRPDLHVGFYYIDFTAVGDGYAPLKNLNGGSQLPTPAIHGNGEIVWIKNRTVVHLEPITEYGSAEELLEKTASLFAE